MDGTKIVSKEHVEMAVRHAIDAHKRKNNIAKSIKTEIMIYVSCTRQINKAVKHIGIKNGLTEICIASIGDYDEHELLEALGVKRYVFKPRKNALKFYDIKEKEIEVTDNPTDLIFERMALLELEK